jgi:hypothetical protein
VCQSVKQDEGIRRRLLKAYCCCYVVAVNNSSLQHTIIGDTSRVTTPTVRSRKFLATNSPDRHTIICDKSQVTSSMVRFQKFLVLNPTMSFFLFQVSAVSSSFAFLSAFLHSEYYPGYGPLVPVPESVLWRVLLLMPMRLLQAAWVRCVHHLRLPFRLHS